MTTEIMIPDHLSREGTMPTPHYPHTRAENAEAFES